MSSTNIRVIDLDAKPKPAILASMLSITEPMVYKAREQGKLPSELDASYSTCLAHYINELRKAASGKAGSMSDALARATVRKLMAQEELLALEIKQKRSELGDYVELAELMRPVLDLILANLNNISRKHPVVKDEINTCMDSVQTLAQRMAQKAKLDSEVFVRSILEKDIDIEDAEREVESAFGLEDM